MKTVKFNYQKLALFASVLAFGILFANSGFAQTFSGDALVTGLEGQSNWLIRLGKWFVRILMIGGACFIVYLAVWDANGKDKLRPYLSHMIFAFVIYFVLEAMWF